LNSGRASWLGLTSDRWIHAASYLAVAGLIVVGVFILALSRQAGGAAEDLQRGRVARLSSPRTEFEFHSVTELVEAIEPSVVQIETNAGMGSGFVLDASGLVVTCHHCIENAFEAVVIFENGTRAPVIGVCKASPELDLAVISVRAPKPLVPLPLAGILPKKGAPVVAFGAPAGLSFTVSEGSVSGLRTGAELVDLHGPFHGSLRGDTEFSLSPKVWLVQITSSTMPGNSGGPVVDFLGNVVGISSFGLNWNGQMLEFCISAEEIRTLAADLDAEVTPLEIYRRH
jgi:S1-C subfamily serine protease